MADRTWGSADGNLNVSTSWNGTIPTGSESWFFPSINNQDVLTNKTDLTALTPTLFYVDKNFGGIIGSDGAPVETSPATLKMYGGSALHFRDGGGTTALVVIACRNSGTIVTLDGTTITKVVILRGNVTIQSSAATIVDVEMGWINNRQTDAKLTIKSSATVTNLKAFGGNVVSNGLVTNMLIDGATVTQDTITATNVDIYSGRFNYNFGGTITLLNLRGGHTDFTLNDKTKTVTDTNRFPNSKFSFDDDTTVFTNPVQDFRLQNK